jgi:hypothetical protein
MLSTTGVPAAAQQYVSGGMPMLEIPTALKVEHEKLHLDLAAATRLGGKTGEAAKQVAAVLHEHFLSEEQFALPPLALLGPIAEDRATSTCGRSLS